MRSEGRILVVSAGAWTVVASAGPMIAMCGWMLAETMHPARGLVFFGLGVLLTPLTGAMGLYAADETARRLRAGNVVAGGCAWCGYDLRGISGVRCPECGVSAALGERCEAMAAGEG